MGYIVAALLAVAGVIAYRRWLSRQREAYIGQFDFHPAMLNKFREAVAQQGIKRAWRLACAREGINPQQPATLPLLFSIDRDLQISNGFHYVPDCSTEIRRTDSAGNYCASHIGCSSGCGGDSASSSSEGGSGDSSGCGGGCGGGD